MPTVPSPGMRPQLPPRPMLHSAPHVAFRFRPLPAAASTPSTRLTRCLPAHAARCPPRPSLRACAAAACTVHRACFIFSSHIMTCCSDRFSFCVFDRTHQITIEELNVLDKLPHYCPVCAYHEVRLQAYRPLCRTRPLPYQLRTCSPERVLRQLSTTCMNQLPTPAGVLCLFAVESDWAGGDDFRVPAAHPHLHQAQGWVEGTG